MSRVRSRSREERVGAYGCKRRCDVLLRSKHEHGEAERGRGERLDEHALCGVDPGCKHSAVRSTSAPCLEAIRQQTYFDASGPGVSANISAAAAMPPRSCATQNRTKRTGPMTPVRSSAVVTLGLKSPPVTRKKSHADTRRLKPNAKETYRMRPRTVWLLPVDSVTCTAPKASMRKVVVPTNSSRAAWMSSLIVANIPLLGVLLFAPLARPGAGVLRLENRGMIGRRGGEGGGEALWEFVLTATTRYVKDSDQTWSGARG